MNVDVLFLEEGAHEAARRGSVTVVVDAIRASATASTALALGAKAVLPVSSVDEAATYVGQPFYRVAGERHGVKCAGFDHGNSPTELMEAKATLLDHTLVLSTSNGTKMVNAARNGAAAVLMGTTVNASAVAKAAFTLAEALNKDIILIGAGEYGQYAEEDACAARVIASHLHTLGASCPAELLRDESPVAVFRATYSADELRELGYEQDIDFCAQEDTFDVAPVLKGNYLVPFQAKNGRAVRISH